MPGFLLHIGATVLCAHGGQATPTVPNPRLTLMGQPSVTVSGPYVIAGCPFVPPAAGPCVTAQWMVGHGARHLERPAAGRAERHRGLRADGHAADARRAASPCHGDVRSR